MQFYETTIYNDELTASFSVLTIPGRSLRDADVFRERAGLTLSTVPEVYDASDINAETLLRLLLAAATDVPLNKVPVDGLSIFANKSGHRELIHFAEYLFHGAQIPFEQSPLAGLSIDKILKSPATIGAAAGFVITAAYGPLFIVAVPAGMIICIAAKGIGDGLADGLKHKIVKGMTGVAPLPKKKSGKKKSKAP